MDTRDRNEVLTARKTNPCLIITTLIVLLASVYIAQSPIFKLSKPLKTNFIKLPPPVPFENALASNNLLSNAKYIGYKKLRGPETIVFHQDGSMYTGLVNGQIVRVEPETDSVHKIVQIGEENDQSLCDTWSLARLAHQSCGAPLGLRFHPNYPDMLYTTDSYYGIVKVNVKTGVKNIILSLNDTRFSEFPLKLPDDLDFDGDIIYFIDSSYEHDLNEALEEHIEALPRGRLFSYNEKTDHLELLVANLYFPNGIQLMPNKNEILISESTMARIIKFYLNGEKKGTKEIWTELPAIGDTIRLSDHGTLFVPFALTTPPGTPSLLGMLGEYPLVRSLLASIIDLHEVIKLSQKYGLAAEYDLNGVALRSWHDPSGLRVECVTSMAVHKNKLYLGSFYNEFIASVEYL